MSLTSYRAAPPRVTMAVFLRPDRDDLDRPISALGAKCLKRRKPRERLLVPVYDRSDCE